MTVIGWLEGNCVGERGAVEWSEWSVKVSIVIVFIYVMCTMQED